MNDRSVSREESTLDYLPEIYRRAADTSDALLGGLIRASDRLLLGLDAKLDSLHRTFSPWHAEASSSTEGRGSLESGPQASPLAWLASWLDFEQQLHWAVLFLREQGADEAQVAARRRSIVANAGRMARQRGTRAGLEQVLRGCLGIHVEVRERTWSERLVVGMSPVTNRVLDHHAPERAVEIIWHAEREPTEALLRGLRRIVDLETPAHLHVLIRVAVAQTPDRA